MPAIPTLHQVLCSAIEARRLLAFSSKDCERIGEPHDYGVIGGVRKLLYYQVGGRSNSGAPVGWRWAETAEMRGTTVLDKRFPGARPAPTGRHVRWEKLFATVSKEEREFEDGD